jgi:hypothetical protein
MTLLFTFVRYEFGILLAAFAAILVFKCLTGGIDMRGLLCDKTKSGVGPVSASRVQLLLVTMAMAGYILSQIVESHTFPEIETKWLVMLGGSHSVFLGAKGVLSLVTSEPDKNK